jgi:hypothetical protein
MVINLKGGNIPDQPNSTWILKNSTQAIKLECKCKLSKGKAIPLQALTGSEGSRRLRLPDFKTIGT